MLGLTFAAARTKHIKLGTSVQVFPDALPRASPSRGRRSTRSRRPRAAAFGSASHTRSSSRRSASRRGDRASIFDEGPSADSAASGRRMRSTTTGRTSTTRHDGAPKPAKRLDVWLGGKAPSSCVGVGKLADGWLASFSSPEDCKTGRDAIEEATAANGAR